MLSSVDLDLAVAVPLSHPVGRIDRKLAIMRDTYAMLNDESQAARAEILEIAIVLLIVAEIVLGWMLPRG